MKCGIIASFLVMISVAEVSAQSCKIGVYFDSGATTNCIAVSEYQVVPVYVIASDMTDGLAAWEGRIEADPTILLSLVSMPDNCSNFAQFPDFHVVSAGQPLYPTANQVVLASLQAFALGAGAIYLRPASEPCEDLADAPAFILASSPEICVLAEYAFGSISLPVATLGLPQCPRPPGYHDEEDWDGTFARKPFLNNDMRITRSSVAALSSSKGGPYSSLFQEIAAVELDELHYPNLDLAGLFWLDPARSRIQVASLENDDTQYRDFNILGGPGSEPGQLCRPLDMVAIPYIYNWSDDYAVANFDLYIADSGNHRIAYWQYQSHKYNVQGERIPDSYSWSSTSIGTQDLRYPIAIDYYYDPMSSGNVLLVGDYEREGIFAYRTNGTLLFSLFAQDLGVSQFRPVRLAIARCGGQAVSAAVIVAAPDGETSLLVLHYADNEWTKASDISISHAVDVTWSAELGYLIADSNSLAAR